MKNYFKTIVKYSLLVGLVAFPISCEQYLDVSPNTLISDTEAFEDFTKFQGFTEELYQCIPDFTNGYWTNSWNWGEDEIQSSARDFHFVCKIDNGNLWGWQSQQDGWQAGWMNRNNVSTDNDRFHKDLWTLGWAGIRKANIGLANIDKLNATQEEKDLIKGQLLFFRGWFHFQFIQYFGGLPYIDTVLPSDQPLRLPRLSYAECANKAGADFRAAADLLPVDWDNTTVGKRTLGKNALRINKIMALGYLGKNYLWAASPLMNKESTGSATYNIEFCKKAAKAFGELLTNTEKSDSKYSLLPFTNYSDNFYTTGKNWAIPGGAEAIFRGPYWGANGSNWGTSKQYQPSPILADGDVKFLPTANYVDNYGMANGLPITSITQADAESGYDPTHPWQGRDPRFYNDIVYDGVKCVKGTLPAASESDRYAKLFTGGSYRNISTGSRTGYLLYKFIPITANKYDGGYDWGNNLNIHIPWMRLSDIYLMYAESAAIGYNSPTAKDEAYNKTAVDAINIVRDRAGVGHVANKFLASVDPFMNEVRRERAVELAFEGHRFNDLRRWMLFIKSPYTLKKSIEFDRDPSFSTANPKTNKVLNIRETVILERNLSDKHYWLPLKNADVNMYLEFAQNPGW
ncbi:RagB/SusD family nutrient uptake outer membrane protein [Flavobacterium cellulosilyticum]|uniref:RagB/SusD family nutrient uptake outer membrane protein n=1 Tax=Flavobacterium cellulosilyticum TaxID=2541731 RepID=A0A4R5CPG5_9FLAO|nr:RagB/SusD family nutrient uptake outer membrane protein [Flavobacterium cellulosilyticum]TDD99504.1 RagB/SusD family nutrient uptake outer membrane protein [Flavobacterium cellulosilyticum]